MGYLIVIVSIYFTIRVLKLLANEILGIVWSIRTAIKGIEKYGSAEAYINRILHSDGVKKEKQTIGFKV